MLLRNVHITNISGNINNTLTIIGHGVDRYDNNNSWKIKLTYKQIVDAISFNEDDYYVIVGNNKVCNIWTEINNIDINQFNNGGTPINDVNYTTHGIPPIVWINVSGSLMTGL